MPTAEGRNVSRGRQRQVGAGQDHVVASVDRPHHLTTARRLTRAEQQSVKLDALIAQRIALVDADHRFGESPDMLLLGEQGPGLRVPRFKGLNAIAQSAEVAVRIEPDFVVLDRRRQVVTWPAPGNVGAHGVEPLDQPSMALTGQAQSQRERQIAAAALARDEDPARVDAELVRPRDQPAQARHAVVQARRIRLDFRRRRRDRAVAEVDHRHSHTLVRNHPAPGLIAEIKRRHHRHPAAVDVVDAGQWPLRGGPHQRHLDRVAVRLRDEGLGRDR